MITRAASTRRSSDSGCSIVRGEKPQHRAAELVSGDPRSSMPACFEYAQLCPRDARSDLLRQEKWRHAIISRADDEHFVSDIGKVRPKIEVHDRPHAASKNCRIDTGRVVASGDFLEMAGIPRRRIQHQIDELSVRGDPERLEHSLAQPEAVFHVPVRTRPCAAGDEATDTPRVMRGKPQRNDPASRMSDDVCRLHIEGIKYREYVCCHLRDRVIDKATGTVAAAPLIDRYKPEVFAERRPRSAPERRLSSQARQQEQGMTLAFIDVRNPSVPDRRPSTGHAAGTSAGPKSTPRSLDHAAAPAGRSKGSGAGSPRARGRPIRGKSCS